MSNVKISQLPEYTGNTSGSWLVMNNSGETTTYKVKKENWVFPYNGDAQITGSLSNNVVNVPIDSITSGSGFNVANVTFDFSKGNLFDVQLTGSIRNAQVTFTNTRSCMFGFNASFFSGSAHNLLLPDNIAVNAGSLSTSGSIKGTGNFIVDSGIAFIDSLEFIV